MIRKSPIKTPMQKKISHIASATSNVVQQGQKLSHAVVSKAEMRRGAKMRSPPAAKNNATNGTTPSRNGGGGTPSRVGTPGRAGIRDMIHKFDSASKNHTMRHRGGADRQQRQRVEDNEGGNEAMPYEKENEANHKQSSSATLTRNGGGGYAFTSRDGIKKLSPAFRRRGVRFNNQNGSTEESSSPVRSNDGGMGSRGEDKDSDRRAKKSPRKSHRDEAGTMMGRQESENGQSAEYSEDEDEEFVDIAELNRAAVIPNSKGNATAHGDKEDRHSNRAHNKNKRDKDDCHPLIQSPLQKHIKRVHSSACSNSMGMVLKEPFPLLPPGQQQTARGNGESNSNEGRQHGKARGGDGGDLLSSAAFMFQKSSRRDLG